MSETRIPGIKALHAVISDNCRIARGQEGAIDEALLRLRESYMEIVDAWPTGKGTNFHLILTVERCGQ